MIAIRVIPEMNPELANWNGDARLYSVDPPLDGAHYVAIERWTEETHVFGAYYNGGPVPHPGGGMMAQRKYSACTHEDALAELGYEVVP